MQDVRGNTRPLGKGKVSFPVASPSKDGGRRDGIAIFSLSMRSVGRSTHAARTAGAHIRYITRPDAQAEVIGVDAKGGVYWGRERVSKAVLRERLHAVAARNPDQAVRIDGDTQAAYQEIVHLMDLCQFEGLTRIAMRTRDGR